MSHHEGAWPVKYEEEAWNVWDNELEDGSSLASIVSSNIPTPEDRLRSFARGFAWLPGEPGETVLDVGCGNGNCRRAFTEVKGMKYSGCDISENMLEIARVQNPGHEFRVGRAEDLPYEDDSFDLTLCLAVLQHLPSEYDEPIISELRRVSRRYAVVGQCCSINSPGHSTTGKYGFLYRVDPVEDVLQRWQAVDPTVEIRLGALQRLDGKAYAGAQRYNVGIYMTFPK